MRNTAKTLLMFLSIAMFMAFMVAGVSAENPAEEKYLIDPKCSAVLITEPEACSAKCLKGCVLAGKSCAYGNPDSCSLTLTEIVDPDISTYINLFGVDFGPPEEAIPVLVRMLLLGAFSVVGLAAIVLGLYGMFLRSTAAESPEKTEESVKVFTNAAIGVAIAFMGVLIVQIVALLLGMTGGLFDFTLFDLEKNAIMKEYRACLDGGSTPSECRPILDKLDDI